MTHANGSQSNHNSTQHMPLISVEQAHILCMLHNLVQLGTQVHVITFKHLPILPLPVVVQTLQRFCSPSRCGETCKEQTWLDIKHEL